MRANASKWRIPLTGHAQELMRTSRSKTSGRRWAAASPIGPPQSWPTNVTLSRPSASTNPVTTSACSSGK